MVSNRTIQIRLTKDQYERIKNYSKIKGFNTLSSYMRFVALEQDFVTQQKISEVHNHLLGTQTNRKFKKNPTSSNQNLIPSAYEFKKIN